MSEYDVSFWRRTDETFEISEIQRSGSNLDRRNNAETLLQSLPSLDAQNEPALHPLPVLGGERHSR
jgi:hypothetical protein